MNTELQNAQEELIKGNVRRHRASGRAQAAQENLQKKEDLLRSLQSMTKKDLTR